MGDKLTGNIGNSNLGGYAYKVIFGRAEAQGKGMRQRRLSC
jgi:hypothetical protein